MSVKCTECGHPHNDWVPLDRLKGQGESLGAKITAAEAKVEAAEAKAADLQARIDGMGDAEAVQKRLDRTLAKLDKLEQEYAADRSQWETSSALLAAGVTDGDDQDLVRYRYNKLPEAGRPSLADYLAKQAREDKYLSALFAKEDASGSTEDAEPQRKAKPLPNSNTGAQPKPPAGSQYTPEAVAKMPYDESRLKLNRDIQRGLGYE